MGAPPNRGTNEGASLVNQMIASDAFQNALRQKDGGSMGSDK